MIYSYLFEAKSIQAYLFQSGKLKDVIAASERLDKMIDSRQDSLLFLVLQTLGLSHDLESPAADTDQVHITFLRCKGGAFYAGSTDKAALIGFRQLWTLTVQQLFPGLVFTDALAEGETLAKAVEQGHTRLAADRNLPQVAMPYATAYSARDQRTGKVALPVSNLAKRAMVANEGSSLDADTHLHRQAYQALELREGTSGLQQRFTPAALRPCKFWLDLEKDFEGEQKKDIALVHIDGNGLGLLLRQLKASMQDKADAAYRIAFRAFSEAVNKATELAAQQATAWLAEQSTPQTKSLPMRPLVLGGDDVTLLCHAKYALQYAETFCRAFELAAEQQLSALKRDYGMQVALTASGGVLYHKAGHPFVQSHHLVEALCAKAKQLTKALAPSAEQAGPAALACYRVSQVVHQDLDEAIAQSHHFELPSRNTSITLAKVAYLVDSQQGEMSWSDLRELARCCSSAKGAGQTSFTLSRWRQMATELANGDFDAADRIFRRGLDIAGKAKADPLKAALAQSGLQQNAWYAQQAHGLFSPLVDLLNLAHFEQEQEQGEPA